MWQRDGFLQSAHVLQPDVPGRAAQAAQCVQCARCLLTKLSKWYKSWNLDYAPRSSPKELDLLRDVLARMLSIRTRHGDFAWYHRKYNHKDTNPTCLCQQDKTPEHLVLCRKTQGTFSRWPLRPPIPPSGQADSLAYTATLVRDSEAFEAFVRLTQYYTKICPR